jgi:hypothetical protein
VVVLTSTFTKKLVFKEVLKNLSDVEHVFLGGAGEDEDVVKVDEDESFQHVTRTLLTRA